MIFGKNSARILYGFVFLHFRHAPCADSRCETIEGQQDGGDHKGNDASVEQVPVRESGGAQKNEKEEGVVNKTSDTVNHKNLR